MWLWCCPCSVAGQLRAGHSAPPQPACHRPVSAQVAPSAGRGGRPHHGAGLSVCVLLHPATPGKEGRGGGGGGGGRGGGGSSTTQLHQVRRRRGGRGGGSSTTQLHQVRRGAGAAGGRGARGGGYQHHPTTPGKEGAGGGAAPAPSRPITAVAAAFLNDARPRRSTGKWAGRGLYIYIDQG